MSNDEGPLPTLDNLAWVPFAGTDQIEILDSHNGVPSLSIVTVDGSSFLCWRAAFYTLDFSLWLYVRLHGAEAETLADSEAPLDGIVFGLDERRFATIGVANELNRLAFEREWYIPAGLTPYNAYDVIVEYAIESMEMAMSQDPPLGASRREIVQNAQAAVRHQLEMSGRS